MASKYQLSDLPQIDARRIAIIKPSALGDVVQSLPLLPALRRRFPDAEISWVIAAGLEEILAGHPDLHETIPFQRKGGWRAWRVLLGTLRRSQFDLVLDLQGLLRSAVMSWATRAPLRIGLETAREGAHLACHLTIPGTSRNVPAHARYPVIAAALGCDYRANETTIMLTDADREWASQLGLSDTATETQRVTLAVQPGAQWVTKRWPPEKFAEVAARAVKQFDVQIVLVGSAAEAEITEIVQTEILRREPAAVVTDLAGQTDLKQLAALLQRVDILLTNDSGPMHLAAGLGTPVVAVFTCTSAVRSGPPPHSAAVPHALISTQVECAASYKKQCPHRGNEHLACLQELDVERVWQGFQQVAESVLAAPSARAISSENG